MPGERVPFGMFYVEVDPESTAEKILAIAAMAPYFIMCALTTLIVRCRELLVCSWLVGHLLNEALNFVLKRTLKERRPPGAPSVGFDEHGMPSAHAQFMGFYLAFSTLQLLMRVNTNPAYKVCAITFNLALSAAVCYGRVQLGFHTKAQVYVGSCIGLAFGAFFYGSCHVSVFPHLPAITRWQLSRLLLLRDGGHVNNVLDFEHRFYHPELHDAAAAAAAAAKSGSSKPLGKRDL